MKFRIVLLCGVIFAFVVVGFAQTRISGTVECGKPDKVDALKLSDGPNHFFVVSQGKCTWTTPLAIAGTESKDDVATVFKEVRANRDHLRGYVTDTTASGDQFTYRLLGDQVLTEGKTESEKGKWTITTGTGKLKGLKGKGTYTGKLHGDQMVFHVEGEYELRAK